MQQVLQVIPFTFLQSCILVNFNIVTNKQALTKNNNKKKICFPQGWYYFASFTLFVFHSVKVEVGRGCSWSKPWRQNLSNALRIWHIHLPPTQEVLMGQRALTAKKTEGRERESTGA